MIGDGSAVIAWAAPTDSGFAFECCGANRREPVDFDGLTLVKFKPAPPPANAAAPVLAAPPQPISEPDRGPEKV